MIRKELLSTILPSLLVVVYFPLAAQDCVVDINMENPWEGLTSKIVTREFGNEDDRPYIDSEDPYLTFHILSPYSNSLLLIDPIYDIFLAESENPDEMSCYNRDEYNVPGYVNWNGRQFIVTDIYNTWNCSKLRKLRLPDTIETIIGGVCTNCKRLEEVDLGNSIRRLGRECFYNTPNLTQIKLPEVLNFIEDKCFVNCGFEHINLNNQLMSIGNGCFSDCTNLKEVELPLSIRSIGANSFNNCPALEKVIINATFNRLYQNSFCNCPSIREVHINLAKPPVLYNSFTGINRDICYVYVPKGCLESYRYEWGNVFKPENILEEGTLPSDIKAMEAIPENETVQTYSLDGMRVDDNKESAHGLLIQRKGGKTTKVIR